MDSLVAAGVRVVVGCLITDGVDGALSNFKFRGAAAEVGIRDLLSMSGVTSIDLIVPTAFPEKAEEGAAAGGRIFSVWIKGHLFILFRGIDLVDYLSIIS